MSKQARVLAAILVTVLFCGITLAQEPVVNISPKLHPNLSQAQRLVAQANRYIEKAQRATHSEMGGHAERARQLLVQASQELKAAAEANNARNKKGGR